MKNVASQKKLRYYVGEWQNESAKARRLSTRIIQSAFKSEINAILCRECNHTLIGVEDVDKADIVIQGAFTHVRRPNIILTMLFPALAGPCRLEAQGVIVRSGTQMGTLQAHAEIENNGLFDSGSLSACARACARFIGDQIISML